MGIDRSRAGTSAVGTYEYRHLPMAKPAAVQHVCTECGTSSGRWLGRCPGCGEFGTMLAEAVPVRGAKPAARSRAPLRLVDVVAEESERIPTGVPELDRVLGGGLVPASLVLVGGEPGVGKSTLLLNALGAISRERRALLVTGEESVAQVKLRAARLGGCGEVEILAETELDAVCETLERERPDVCVIDSVQTLWSQEIGSAPGSVAQVREAASRLLRVSKESGVATFLVGHVTKDGSVAGPRVLEHLVDCVLQFEGDRYHAHRILRAVKNRFGSTNELGVFEMTGTGLVGVPDPSALFGRTEGGEVGAAVTCALEGTRPLLLEIQSLVAPTDLAMPRRVGTGVDPKRLAMIVAVLSRHAGLPLGGADVFVNVAGGVRIDEPGADLGIALAIASAAQGRARARGSRRLRRDRADRPASAGDPDRPPGRGMSQVRPFSRSSGPGWRRSGRLSRPLWPISPTSRHFRENGVFAGFLVPCPSRRWSLFEAAGTFCDYGRNRRRSLYKVGDKVVYPHHGAGTVVKREKREVLGEKREYLTIKILHNDMTVNVPADNAERVGLRKVIDEEAVKKVVKYLTSGGTEMPKNWNRRFKHNRDKMKTGDIYELAEVVRNLALRDGEKGLSTGEKQMYVKAKKILASELMYAKNMSEDEALEWLELTLTEGREAEAHPGRAEGDPPRSLRRPRSRPAAGPRRQRPPRRPRRRRLHRRRRGREEARRGREEGDGGGEEARHPKDRRHRVE